MLNKIKNKLAAAGIFFAIATYIYFKGLRKGQENEKIKSMEKIQRNIAAAARARAMLRDSDYVRRLHDKYKRG